MGNWRGYLVTIIALENVLMRLMNGLIGITIDHGSLEFYGYLETPYEAFWRKLSPESLIHVMEERII